MTQPHEDEYGDILRRVLRAEADEVTPSPEGLERIRAAIDSRSQRMWWRMPWVRPAMAVGGALVLAAVVMAGTPGIRQTVMAAFNGEPTTPTGSSTPIGPPGNNKGYPTNGATSGTPSPTDSGSPSQGPGGGPCGPGGQVTTLHTPSATVSPSDCPSTPPPDTQTEVPTSPTPPTSPTDNPPPRTSPTPPHTDSPTTDPKPSDSAPVPESSP